MYFIKSLSKNQNLKKKFFFISTFVSTFVSNCLLYQHLKTKNLKIKILPKNPTAKCYKQHVHIIFFSSCQNLFNLEIPNLVGY